MNDDVYWVRLQFSFFSTGFTLIYSRHPPVKGDVDDWIIFSFYLSVSIPSYFTRRVTGWRASQRNCHGSILRLNYVTRNGLIISQDTYISWSIFSKEYVQAIWIRNHKRSIILSVIVNFDFTGWVLILYIDIWLSYFKFVFASTQYIQNLQYDNKLYKLIQTKDLCDIKETNLEYCNILNAVKKMQILIKTVKVDSLYKYINSMLLFCVWNIYPLCYKLNIS